MCIVERSLMLKEVIMHLPELLLDGGSFRSLRGMLSMRVALGQGKVPKDKAQPIPQTSLNLLDNGIGLSTIRDTHNHRIPPVSPGRFLVPADDLADRLAA